MCITYPRGHNLSRYAQGTTLRHRCPSAVVRVPVGSLTFNASHFIESPMDIRVPHAEAAPAHRTPRATSVGRRRARGLATHHAPDTAYRIPFTTHQALSTTYQAPSATYQAPSAACRQYGACRRDRGLPQKSHAIRLDDDSTKSENVAIPTLRFQVLK